MTPITQPAQGDAAPKPEPLKGEAQPAPGGSVFPGNHPRTPSGPGESAGNQAPPEQGKR